ncbi:hypothetical protein BN1708_014887 [Verticillium longisporum]|uniref:Uncharacterized protein n=1 Tax=Verticillium longisporum TaxID=100787 RepID=A0A0G4M1E7_VERLO|nr:hypothetical protein BN1708_014887 [Verticillium longisporum]
MSTQKRDVNTEVEPQPETIGYIGLIRCNGTFGDSFWTETNDKWQDADSMVVGAGSDHGGENSLIDLKEATKGSAKTSSN